MYIYFTFLRLHQIATIVCNPKAHAVKQISAKDFFCIGAMDMKVLWLLLSYRRLIVECCREMGKTGVQHICDSLHFNAKITMQPDTRSLASTVEMKARGIMPVCKLSCSKGISTTRYQQPPADIIQPFTCAGSV